MHFNAMCLIVKLCISCEPADPDVDEIRPCKFWVKGKANISSIKPQIPTNVVSSVLGGRKIKAEKITNPARRYLKLHYGNGFFWQCLPFSWTTLLVPQCRNKYIWAHRLFIGKVEILTHNWSQLKVNSCC